MGINFDAAIEIFQFTIGLCFVGGLLLFGIVMVGRYFQGLALSQAIKESEEV